MRKFRRLCVYGGASKGHDATYAEEARALGMLLARHRIEVVYGGGRIGLMGALAEGALSEGGHVIGVIPEKLYNRETAHEGLSELIVVESMHTRKAIMAHLADGFIAMPGGWGTFEELFEMSAWAQLRFHAKPIGLLNTRGYFTPLLTFLEHATREGFAHPEHGKLVFTADTPAALLDALSTVA